LTPSFFPIINTILLAESHVYTTWEDYKDENGEFESMLPNYPKNYVRFIYCINYGEKTRGQRTLKNKGGTPQFWRIFYSTLYWVESNKEFELTKDFNEKLKILHEMKKRGIWLVDASISGLYIPGGSKPNPTKIREALCYSWNYYVKDVIEHSNPERLIVIGKTVWNAILPLLPSNIRLKSDWVYQPNARLLGDGHKRNYQKIYQLCNPNKAKAKDLPSIRQINTQRLKIQNKMESAGEKPKAVYKFYRLCFLAEEIEPLDLNESFRVICPEGIFQMTKEEFYREFSNVVKSRSYRDGGKYHYPKPPNRAFQFLIKVKKDIN